MLAHQSVLIKINPGVLKWAMTSTGWETKELAQKTKIKSSSINTWQKQESSIELSQLKKIAKSLKIPLTSLYLPTPPTEFTLPYYRTVGGTRNDKLSKKTCAIIRNARYTQSIAAELLELRYENTTPQIRHFTLDDDPEEVAKTVTNELKLDELRKQIIHKPSEAFKNFRSQIESLNIFVMQSSMKLDEARGFSLTDKYPKFILVSSKDKFPPRIFTLLHECAHILLNERGICIPNCKISNTESKNIHKIEKWCNAFAGVALMPKDDFLAKLQNYDIEKDLPSKIVNGLSKTFGVSNIAACVRILNLLKNSPHIKVYSNYYDYLTSQKIIQKTKKNSSSGGISAINRCIYEKGEKFIALVLDSRHKDLITFNKMSRFLNLDSKHFDQLESKI